MLMDVRAAQLSNAQGWTTLTESGITIDLSDLQPVKVWRGIDDMELGRTAFSKDAQ